MIARVSVPLFYVAFALTLAGDSLAQGGAGAPTPAPGPVPAPPVPPATGSQASDRRDFAGLNFGVGFSLSQDLGGNKRVKSAVVENGIVRVTEDNNARSRVMLESHYFFQPLRPIPECRSADDGFSLSSRNAKGCQDARKALAEKFDSDTRQNWGFGPFVALQPGTDEIIEAIGAGFMVGFKRGGENNNSLNIGLGAVVDTSVQILGDGFAANEEAPVDDEGDPLPIRYRETDQWGWLFLASFSFD